MSRPVVGRLAPTPSGQLHLGNVIAFATAWLSARGQDGTVVLRVEDVDKARARRSIEDDQKADLEWLGLHWDRETTRQSERDYEPWLQRLAGHTYLCTCTRAMVRAAGGVYPGTCRGGTSAPNVEVGWQSEFKPQQTALTRFRIPEGRVAFVDRRWGAQNVNPASIGDPVLQRRDGVFAYPLAVVSDDIADGVTEVVRGSDLLPVTAVQIRLWQAFNAAPPTWLHSPLVLGSGGKKLSKSHGSVHLGALRDAGWTAPDVWRAILPWLGLSGDNPKDAALSFVPTGGPLGPIVLDTDRLPSPAEGLSWRLEGE
ncbi:MAG: glutamate--tRNA ligase family protein [Myxococcota bacterium]